MPSCSCLCPPVLVLVFIKSVHVCVYACRYVCVCVHAHICTRAHMRLSLDNLWESVLSYYVGSGEQTPVIRLGDEYF